MTLTSHLWGRTSSLTRILAISAITSLALILHSFAAEDTSKPPSVQEQISRIDKEETLMARRLKRLEALQESMKDTYSFALHNALRHCYQTSNMSKEGWRECNIILEKEPMQGYIVGTCLAGQNLDKDAKRAMESIQGVLRKTGDYPFVQAAGLIQLGDLYRAEKKEGMAKNQYNRVLKLTAPGIEPYTKIAQQRLEAPAL